MAARLNYLKRQAVADGQANVKLEFDFLKPASKSSIRRTLKKRALDNEGTSKEPSKKRKVEQVSAADFDEMYELDDDIRPVERVEDEEDGTEGESFDWSFSMREEHPTRRKVQKHVDHDVIVLSD